MKNFLLLLTTTFFLLQPNVNFAQAPNLGTAAPFALFTSVGAFNVNGSTDVTGDVGTNAGAFNGFPPGILTGTKHVVDGTSATAAIDVCAAYDNLRARPCGTVIGVGLGGQTLTPGEYCIGAAATLAGNLTLDGAGVYVIKIDGAFASAAFSTVTLLNGATVDNIFFQVNGEVDLGANSTFNGIIFNTGVINLLNASFLNGKAFSCAGAINVHNATVNFNLTLLPIRLMNFSATRQGENAILKWSTVSEENSKDFIVERSNTAQPNTWVKIGTLAAAGNSTATRQYSLTDNNVNKGDNYYRLQSRVINGSLSISNVRFVSFNVASPIKVFPNPVKNMLTVNGASQGSALILTDITGKTLNKQNATGNGIDQVETRKLSSGTYLLKIVSADGKTINIKLNKQ